MDAITNAAKDSTDELYSKTLLQGHNHALYTMEETSATSLGCSRLNILQDCFHLVLPKRHANHLRTQRIFTTRNHLVVVEPTQLAPAAYSRKIA